MLKRYLSALTSGDDSLAEWAATGIGLLPAEQHAAAVSALDALLEDSAEDRRWWSLRALSEIPAESVPPLLIAALQDPSPEVRQCAALGLRMQRATQALPALLDALQDPDPLTALLAAEALVALGEPAVASLLALVANSPQAVRLLAIRALAEIRDPQTIPALFAALDDESMLIEYWANEGLERMGVGMTFFKP
jgi:HEAT repeat protein